MRFFALFLLAFGAFISAARADARVFHLNKYVDCATNSASVTGLRVAKVAYEISWNKDGSFKKASGTAEVYLEQEGKSDERYIVKAVAVPAAQHIEPNATLPFVSYRGVRCTAHHWALVSAKRLRSGGNRTAYLAGADFFGIRFWVDVSVTVSRVRAP
ncbi:MAG TPA: hypothetical protein VHD55_02975 [Candidatus Paceibacterota bacterium]|nr:hypothetical protein [Candidatus Paceibacterota bacterium]